MEGFRRGGRTGRGARAIRGHLGHGPGRGGRGASNNYVGQRSAEGRGGRGRRGHNGYGEQHSAQSRGGIGSDHNARAGQESRQITGMTHDRLLELMTKEPTEVLLTLRSANCGFLEMVNAVAVGPQILITIVKVIASACKSTLHIQNLMSFMTDMLNSTLPDKHLPKYLNRVQCLGNISNKMEFLQDMTVPLKSFFKTAFMIVPTLATDKLELSVTSFQTCLGAVLQQLPSSTANEYRDMLVEMEDIRKMIVQPYVEAEKKASQRKLVEAGEPPENFREIQIAPSTAELQGDVEPFLRENIVSGRYKDGEHYLDVQFRLIREDFVGPLREGIVKYRELVGAALNDKDAARALKEMKELRIYCRVKIQEQESTGSGIVFVLKLDTTALGNVKWDNSKRLLTGSLLCMSHDDFANIAQAVVVRRDVAKLKQGLLSVQIIEGKAILDAPNAHRLEFVLAESPTYFEAFSPILKGLQALEGDNLPFSKYLIDIKRNISSPKYAKPDMCFDLSPLLFGIGDEDGEMCLMLPEPKMVPILHASQWPDKEEFGLDASQFAALQGALTRELAIIQGPPGTGKTFLGLKVVEALVHNLDVWQQRKAPILTICFTNHALDQFLEGILEQMGSRKIVRVGGGSNSEKLKPYNLAELRKNEIYYSKTVPLHIRQARKTIRWEMKQVGKNIAKMGTLLNEFQQKAINENELRQFMTNEHFEELRFVKRREHVQFGMMVWLSGTRQEDFNIEDKEVTNPQDIEAEKTSSDIILDVEEDFDENQRIVDADCFDITYGRIGFQEDANDDNDIPKAEIVNDQGWQVQGWKKSFKKIFRREMKSGDVMTEEETGCVQSLEDLMPKDRWRLYRFWVFKMRDAYLANLGRSQQEHERIYRQLQEVEMEETIYILKNAAVVGMTTTGAAKNQIVLQTIKPQIVIVEEAAEVLEAHILTALTCECDHLILIGDHQQLRPNPTVYKLASRYNLDVSLFERMIKNGMPFESLKLQHRMRPQIARLLVPNIYKNLLNHPSVEDRPRIRGVGHNVYFVDHAKHEKGAIDSTSKENLFEADYAVALCRHLILQGYEGEKITVLTTYVGQMFQLKNRMRDPLYEGVRTTVVDNYQGEENDIIILSLVRSNAENKIGFLKVENRVCVALSRARNGLFVIGNFNFLVENGCSVWNPIVNHLTRAELIGPSLRLMCQNHRDYFVDAKSAADFKKAPEGGCIRPCPVLMSCGHMCNLACHSYDPDHVTSKTYCYKPCNKTCERGHGCKKKCFEDCGKCQVPVDVVIPRCGHIANIRCCQELTEAKCQEDCNRKYQPCGHKCPAKCHDKCLKLCYSQVDVTSPCGHIVKLPCGKKEDMKLARNRCTEPCATMLDCEHKCPGTCSNCYQGRFHMRCKDKCCRILVCGHPCIVDCAVVCPPCNRQCGYRCTHSKCTKQCGEPCKRCMKECPWQCDHYKCTKPCYMECDRLPCQEPCQLDLKCGHKCIGMCGEPCPKKCRICHRDEVCELLFGDEDKGDARFVELADCGHVIEVNAMDRIMTGDEREVKSKAMLMKGCPKCNVIVRRSLRYGNQLKRILNDAVQIKKRVLGEKENKDILIKEIQRKCCTSRGWQFVNSIIRSIEDSLCRFNISRPEYSVLDNLAMVTSKISEIYAQSRPGIHDRLEEIEGWIFEMIPQTDAQYGSEQQLKEVVREMNRVTVHLLLIDLPRRRKLNEQEKASYDTAISIVSSLQPFTRDKQIAVETIQGVLGIKTGENMKIVKAVGMSKGQWFICPNGHNYAITELEDVMVEGSCNECKATTDGGQSYYIPRMNCLPMFMPSYTTNLRGNRGRPL